MNTRAHLCPTPTKTVFLTREAAQRALERLPVLSGATAYYECRCGRYHLTSQPQMP
jgi:hypothetical protein